jgi:hypothetical protein
MTLEKTGAVLTKLLSQFLEVTLKIHHDKYCVMGVW